MRDDDDRAAVAAQLEHLLRRLLLELGVTTGERLVDEKDLGIEVARRRRSRVRAFMPARVRLERELDVLAELCELDDRLGQVARARRAGGRTRDSRAGCSPDR